MKTKAVKASEITRSWYLVDAEGIILGRLATKVATILKGKHKPIYTPHLDTGDHVIVVNADKIRLTGKKLKQKNYYHHSTYPGGLKVNSLEKVLNTRPERVVQAAVRGMLPKNTVGRHMLGKLKVYAGSGHPHDAQMPQPLEIL
ncbi:MAG: 50S ribosomal protein L13 [Candidatus Schekmanbacteria bacterium]|nr:50S ribosomal protein L13 [Candidatus Schekmanbacteria bacterium]